MDLSICLLAHDGVELTASCLESIGPATGRLSVETILVDNGSTDGTAATVAERFPWVRLIRNPVNCGFSVAVNQGVERATGRHLLILNNDTKLVPPCLETVVDFLDRTPDAGIVTPQLVYEDGRLQNSIANFPSFPEIFVGKTLLRALLPGRYPSKMRRFEKPTEVKSVVGAAMFVRRALVERIGALDERFFIFFEETDWCLRARKAGWKNYLLPDPKIVHHQGQTVDRTHLRKRIEYATSLFLYFRKHHPAAYPWLRVLFPLKLAVEASFSFLGTLLTLGLSRRARRRLAEKWGSFAWRLRGCPEGCGLKPDGFVVPPGRESLRPRDLPVEAT